MKIAVVGSGISGLASAFLLQEKPEHQVTLFEADTRLGGHANTLFVKEDGQDIPVDTGFLVFNEKTYPNLVGLFRHLQVEVAESDMSLSVRFQQPSLEWGGANLPSLFAQKRNLFRPAFWNMLSEIMRFNREAESNLVLAQQNSWSLGSLLEFRGFSAFFRDWYLVPMGAAIWSTPSVRMLDFPAETFLTFCRNHNLLQVNDRPVWKTVRNGSIQYVQKIAKHLRDVRLNSPVEKIKRVEGGVELTSQGKTEVFDAVILACHPPQSLKMLEDATEQEKDILSQFRYQANPATLHSDESYLPRRKKIWSSWNFHGPKAGLEQDPVKVSYLINRLQPLRAQRPYVVTLNSDETPAQTWAKIDYEHPLFDRHALKAQERLSEIQGRGGLYHAGAWTRYGFHEDGILSAVRVAERFGITPPWLKS